MKIKKINKYFNIFFIISLISIFTSIVLVVAYSFFSAGRVYVTVNDKNRESILKMLKKFESEVIINNDIVRIGKMQGLGDWYLYIKYDNGEEKAILLDDGNFRDLYKYIGSNGSYGGILGILTETSIKISIISIFFMPIYITFKICYVINRTTERQIQNSLKSAQKTSMRIDFKPFLF